MFFLHISKLLIMMYLTYASITMAYGESTSLGKFNNGKGVSLYVAKGKGNDATMRISPTVKTPTGEEVLDLILKKLGPDSAPQDIQIIFPLHNGLQKGKTYELNFLCKGSNTGTLTLMVSQMESPFKQVPGSSKVVGVAKNWQEVKIAFTAQQDWTERLAAPRFMLAGFGTPATLHFGPVRFQEVLPLQPFALHKKWSIFLGVAAPKNFATMPNEISGVKPIDTKLNGNSLDIGKLAGGFKEKNCAILYNQFESANAGRMRFGVSADWWMELYINGEKVFSTLKIGNNSLRFDPEDHIVEIPVKAGMNLLAVKVLSGSNGWRFACGAIEDISPRPPIHPRMTEMFIEPEKTARLHFSKEKGDVSEEDIDYRINNYSGGEVGKGKLKWDKQEQAFTTNLTLQKGFYELSIPATKQQLGIIVFPPYKGKCDEFFAISAILQMIHRNPPGFKDEAYVRNCLRILKRAGIKTIREMDHWFIAEKIEGKTDWSFRLVDKVYKFAAEEDIKILNFFGNAPSWTGAIKRQPPTNLLKLERSFVESISRKRPALVALQVWNEPDLAYLPGDVVIPLEETISWIFARNNINIPIIGNAFSSHFMSDLKLLEPYIQSGMLDYIDVFAFHSYRDPAEMISMIKFYRAAMKSQPKAAMPIWITECGQPWQRGSVLPQVGQSWTYGKPRAFVNEDKKAALSITMKAVEAKAGGIEKFFPFTLRFMEENGINYGMMDLYYTPMRSMAAYINCIHTLSHKTYVGDLVNPPKGIKIARIFSDGKEAIAVLYTGDISSKDINIKALPFVSATMMDGRPLPINQNGWINIEGMAYVTLARNSIHQAIQADTEAMTLLKLAQSYRPIARKRSPVVFQFANWEVLNKDQFSYYGCPKEIKANIFNFSDHEIKITPELLLPKNGRIISTSIKRKELILKPVSSTPIAWNIDLSKCAGSKYPIVLREKNNLTAALFLSFIDANKVDNAKKFEFDKPERWRNKGSGDATISYDREENAVKFHVDFTKEKSKTFSACQEYVLDIPGLSFKGTSIIVFDIKGRQKDNGATEFAGSVLRIVYQNGKIDTIYFSRPDKEWQSRFIHIDSAKAADIKAIRIEILGRDNIFDFWLKNVNVYIP